MLTDKCKDRPLSLMKGDTPVLLFKESKHNTRNLLPYLTIDETHISIRIDISLRLAPETTAEVLAAICVMLTDVNH